MSEPNVIRCLQCKRSFDRSTEGAQDFLDHRDNCQNPDLYRHPANHTPKGA